MDTAGEIRGAFSATLAEMTALQADQPEFVVVPRLLADLRSSKLQRAFDGIEDALAVARVMFAPFAYRHQG